MSNAPKLISQTKNSSKNKVPNISQLMKTKLTNSTLKTASGSAKTNLSNPITSNSSNQNNTKTQAANTNNNINNTNTTVKSVRLLLLK